MVIKEDIIRDFYKWFDEFTDGFYSDEINIQDGLKSKREHTIRVCENILQIGQSLKLSKNELYIAETIALFHDIGRFVQYKKHKTFFDSIKNHAELSVTILEDFNILCSICVEEKNIILKAILYHNIRALPKEQNDKILLFSKLIRDADKMDNYYLHVKHFEEHSEYHKSILERLPDIPQCSKKIIKDILNNRCPMQSDIKTYNDWKLTYISWVFDINFEFTIREIDRNKYIERIVKVLPNNNSIKQIYNHVRAYIEMKLESNVNL